MELNQFKYSKDSGNREEELIKKHVEKKTPSTSKHMSLPNIELPSDYTKPEGQISVRILFILSGGEDREKNYFKMLKNDHKIERIKVAFSSKKGQGLNPTQLLETAKRSVVKKKFVTEEATYQFEKDNGDIIYLLQDIDQFESEIRRLAVEDQPECLRWIYSNPAFEIWLFYHYFNNPLPLLEGAIGKTTAERSKWLKKYLPKIIVGGVQTTKEISKMRTAIENSKANYKASKMLPDLFSTQMHILAEDILDIMGNEFDKMLERKVALTNAKKEKYRKPIVKSIRYDGEKIRGLIADFSKWAENHLLLLPHVENRKMRKVGYYDNRVFPLSYKFEKAILDDNSGRAISVGIDELFLKGIQNEIYHFYQLLFIQNNPISSYTIDFSQIKDVIDLLGLDSHYAILATFHLSTFDTLYGGEALHETDYGYTYKDLKIYKTISHGRFMIIMRKEYLPKADFKRYEGGNTEFELIDGKNLIYSNIHQMKDLGEHYGLSVMRAIKFQIPPKGSFRFIKLNIVDYHKEKSEFNKLSKADTVKLQYQKGDFVTYKNNIYEIVEILKEGDLKLSYMDGKVSLKDICPIKIDGVEDASIYYDPYVAAFTINHNEPIPSVTTNDQYYMESLKNDILEDGVSLYEKISEFHFAYVHELQHWLLETQGQSGLKIK